LPDEIETISISFTNELLAEMKVSEIEERGFVVSSQEVSNPETADILVSLANISRFLFKYKLVKSRSEANRLINQRAVSIDGKKINIVDDPDVVKYGVLIKDGSVIQVGKRRHIKVINSDIK